MAVPGARVRGPSRPRLRAARARRRPFPGYDRVVEQLSPRRREILRRVVEEHVATGQPVGSKVLVERAGMHVSSSTVRSELAELEALGLLTHPHTSAGRVPTEQGYRYYADELLGRLEPQPPVFPLDLASTSTEVESEIGRAHV